MKHKVSLDETGTRSVRRAAELLRLLGRGSQPASLTELARAADLSKATAYRILQTLASEGLAELESDTGRYALGAEFIRIATVAQASSQHLFVRRLEALSAAAMRNLSDRTGETTALVIRRGDHRTNVAVELGTHELIAVPRVGSKLPLHLGGPGKLLVAFMPPAELESLARRSELSQLDAHVFDYTPPMQASLRAIREAGYATSFAEAVDGQASVAFPVLQEGAVVAALNLIVPTVRVTETKQAKLLPLVRKAAAQISGMLANAPHE